MDEVNASAKTSADLSSILSSLLSNPDAISKVNGIISQYTSSDGENKAASETAPSESAEPPSETKIPDLLSLISSSAPTQNKEQTALLLAIRPYLSPHRRELIDGFIRMSKLTDIIKKLT